MVCIVCPCTQGQKHWYLVYCKPRQEFVARDNLERQGYEAYLPLVEQRKTRKGKRTTVVEPLFSRYLFIHLDNKTDNWGPIRSTVGVASLVRFGPEPTPAPEGLVALLRKRENIDGYHDLSTVQHLQPGDTVRITQGAMLGYEGIFTAKSSQDRVLVLLEIMGKQSRVSLPRDVIELDR